MNSEEFTTRELTEKQLKFSYWFVTHKIFLKRLLLAILIIFNIWIWGYSIYGIFRDLVINNDSRTATMSILPQSLVNFTGLREHNAPKPLEVSNIQILSSGQERYDFIALVKNYNKEWTAKSFNYKFEINGVETKTYKGFILPDKKKYLINLSVRSKIRPHNARLNITNVKWQRVDRHKIKDINKFINDRINFEITNIKFSSATTTGLGGKVPVSSTTFDVYNNTAYNYWQAGFYIFLYRGSAIEGVNYVTAEKLRAGEKRNIEARWFEPLPAATSVEIQPVLNVLDPDSYMEFKGGFGE